MIQLREIVVFLILLPIFTGCSVLWGELKPDEPIVIKNGFLINSYSNLQGRPLSPGTLEADLLGRKSPEIKPQMETSGHWARASGMTSLVGLGLIIGSAYSSREDTRALLNYIGYPLVVLGTGMVVFSARHFDEAVRLRNQEVAKQAPTGASLPTALFYAREF